ncbi:nucleotide exchange factor GrpE [Calothrix rhizosoleniae]|uniref:nucleotide exchange factor GrpE n=1 Tax=Calothrix rhizosoleniae TaxID=888997 RepID=UPI000B4A2C0A|nr:nucleotide exchange factor GrpE [Calothrix rhizosoleniae]
MSNTDFTQRLRELMQQVGVASFRELSRKSGISERQILQLRRGKIEKMRLDPLLQLSSVLNISLSELVDNFSGVKLENGTKSANPELLQQIADLQTEYQRSQQQLAQQQELLQQEFQQSILQILESLFLQFPTAAYKAQENPQLPAVKIIPLVQKPLDQLLQAWGMEAIAVVGAEVPYNPQKHQLMDGTLAPGEIVKVRYTGYRKGNKLLYRAKVSPV